MVARRSRPAPFDTTMVKAALSLARRFVARPQDVEDVAQEALLKLVTYADRIENPEAWLFVVIGRDARRQSALSRTVPGTSASIDPWPAVDLALDARRVLARLPIRDRQALLLAFEGWSERETAARLGCSVKATEKSLHRARATARKLRSMP